MSPQPVVRARALTKTFGDVIALDAVDLDIMPGQVHGLVGPNGAGKTTLLGLLLGLSVPDSGTLELLGTTTGGSARARRLVVPDGVAGFVDGPGLYPALTARQNLVAVGRLRGLSGDLLTEVDATLADVGLSDVADDRLRGFSLGMRQRLGLAAALLTRPRLLVLDEPANGLDPAGKQHVHRVLTRLADDGVAVVLSSHRMDDLAALCSDVTILTTGRVMFTGPIAKLAAESGELAYRLGAADMETATALADDTPGLQVMSRTPLVVRGAQPAMDDLVARIVGAGIALRELTPAVSPLEAAFLALTEEAR